MIVTDNVHFQEVGQMIPNPIVTINEGHEGIFDGSLT